MVLHQCFGVQPISLLGRQYRDLGTVSINVVVTPVRSAHNLGVIIDRFLNFSSHINVICKSGLPSYQLDKLQSMQNSAARLVTRVKSCDHISQVLRDLLLTSW